ncbi:MAG TPA: protein-disulfide reductase DsbD domain-containing protein [Pyrinomonadaceae bacterium]
MNRRVPFLIITATLFAACHRNNGGGISSGTGGWPPSSAPAQVSSSAQVVKMTVSPVQIAPGGAAEAVVRLAIMPGYHVNANPATYPYLIATEIKPEKAKGITADKPTYPAAKTRKFQFADEPLAVYEDEAEVKLPLRADAKTAGEISLPITVRVQACDNEKCFPPATLDSAIPITVK